jgi:mRNA-degrading endonuclease HigB of HigAB toxin-antitoxin module
MRLITARTVKDYGRTHPDAAQAIATWCAMVEAARWVDADALRRAVGRSVRPI